MLLECFWLVCCGLACMQTETSLPLCNELRARDTHANDASGEHWSFLGQIVCLLVSYRTLARAYFRVKVSGPSRRARRREGQPRGPLTNLGPLIDRPVSRLVNSRSGTMALPYDALTAALDRILSAAL